MEDTLEKPIGRAVMDEYFAAKDKSKNDDLVQLLLSMSRSDLSPEFAARVLKFFNKLFAMHEKNPIGHIGGPQSPKLPICQTSNILIFPISQTSKFPIS